MQAKCVFKISCGMGWDYFYPMMKWKINIFETWDAFILYLNKCRRISPRTIFQRRMKLIKKEMKISMMRIWSWFNKNFKGLKILFHFEESKEDFSWIRISLREIPEFSPHVLLPGFGRVLPDAFPKENYINKIQYHFSHHQVVFPIKSSLFITSTIPLPLNWFLNVSTFC